MIHGLVLVNKPKGTTSHQVVDHIRKHFKVKKAGHFGTLDPLAEGLLLIGVGHATKFFNFYLKKTKCYSGLIRFGCATSTYDAEGDPITEEKEIDLNRIDIPGLLSSFTGKFMQMPPIYSAKKFKGKPLYKYARQNKQDQVEIKPAQVEIYQLKGNIKDNRTLWFEAHTSSGTYIRSLAHDIGEKTGAGAYLRELKRIGVGEFNLEKAFNLDEIADLAQKNEFSTLVTPIEALLPEFPKIIVNHGGRSGILNGMPLHPADIMKVLSLEKVELEHFRIFDDQGKLLAIARKEDRVMRFKPFIVFPA